MPSRILHVSNTDIRNDSRILKELKVASDLRGVAVSAFGVPAQGGTRAQSIDGVEYREQELFFRRFSLLPRPVRYFFEMIEFTVRAVLFARRVRPAVIHCHDTFALPTGYFASVLFGSTLIYDAHELESDKNGQNAILSSVTLWIEKLCWKKVDLLISVSDAIIDWYMKELGAKDYVLVLNSPEIAQASAHDSSTPYIAGYFNRQFGIPANSRIFVYLGILGPGRGIDTIAGAFSNLGVDAHVVFVGFGPLTTTIQELSERNERIHFHDAVQHDQVVALVRNADFGLCLIENVSLSDYYCLPNKLFEYAFAGLPVLASRFPEIERVVGQYSLGVCCDLDVESVRRGIEAMVTGGAAGAERSLTELSWSAQASRLSSAYEDLLCDRFARNDVAKYN